VIENKYLFNRVFANSVLLGEFRNADTSNLRYLDWVVIFYDSRGGLFDVDASGMGRYNPWILRPGETWAFECDSHLEGVAASCKAFAFAERTTEEPVDLRLSHVRVTRNPSDYLDVTGTLTSYEAGPVEDPWIKASFKDSAGRVIGYADDWLYGTRVNPGQSLTFELHTWDWVDAYTSYSVVAQADRVESTPTPSPTPTATPMPTETPTCTPSARTVYLPIVLRNR